MKVDRSRLPDVSADASVRFPVARRSRLANGLRVWTVDRRDVPVLTYTLIVPSGSVVDPPGAPGLAALTADLLDEGVDDRDAIEIHKELARIGGQLETDTGYDATFVSLTTLARFHQEASRLLADVTFRPRLDEADFSRVRELRCNRLTQMRDLPSAQAEQAFVRQLFGDHPYGHLPIGTEESLRAISTEGVRAFHGEHYRLDGALLVVVGSISHDQALADAEDTLAGLATGSVAFPSIRPPSIGGEGRRLVILDRPNAPQSELRVGHVAVSRATPDFHALVVLNAILGGQFVSRINLNLREDKGFTYGARSGFDWRRAPGPFVVQTSVQTDATAAAVREVLNELRDIGSNRPPTNRELTLAKASLTRGYARNFETADQIARGLTQLALYDLPLSWFDEFVGRVQEIDHDAVRQAASRHLRPDDMLVTVVGDRARIEDGLTALGFGTTTVAGPA